MALKSRFPAKKGTAVVSQWSCHSSMFLKMTWPTQRFEPTDSEHNFILLSERFNLKRVSLCMYVIAATEPYRVSESAKSSRKGSARRQMLKSIRNPETACPRVRRAAIVGTLLV